MDSDPGMNARFLRYLRFCTVGCIVAVVDFSFLWTFCHFLPRLAAVSIAYFLGVMTHFLLNKFWVFEARCPLGVAETFRYSLSVAACWVSTVSLVWLALNTVTEQVLLAKAMAVPPTTLLAYCIMRFYVFPTTASPRVESV